MASNMILGQLYLYFCFFILAFIHVLFMFYIHMYINIDMYIYTDIYVYLYNLCCLYLHL